VASLVVFVRAIFIEMPIGYPPSVFVSSTCYDLNQVRLDLKRFIEGLGYEAVVSEHPAFPVNPQVGTVINCVNAGARPSGFVRANSRRSIR
jgi:hypothetical protein